VPAARQPLWLRFAALSRRARSGRKVRVVSASSASRCRQSAGPMASFRRAFRDAHGADESPRSKRFCCVEVSAEPRPHGFVSHRTPLAFVSHRPANYYPPSDLSTPNSLRAIIPGTSKLHSDRWGTVL